MNIDISQFHQSFFEESFERLEVMEVGLLGFEEDKPNIETIFRAAHFIKRGADTFGFMTVSDFTHHLETLLDEMRNGKREITRKAKSVCLQAVDLLREMLSAVQTSRKIDEARVEEVVNAVQMLLGNTVPDVSTQPEIGSAPETSEPYDTGWNIAFISKVDLLQTGNDPARFFFELGELGDITVKLDGSRPPAFTDLDPGGRHLRWTIELRGAVDQAAITEIFEEVEDCELEIKPIDEAVPQLPHQVSSIRVGTEKVDSLINLIGELVVTQSMLSQMWEDIAPERLPELLDGLEQLECNTRALQEGIMQIRTAPTQQNRAEGQGGPPPINQRLWPY